MHRFALATLICLALSTGAQAETKTLRIATGEYEPFTGENLPDHGVVNARVKQIADAAGFAVEFHYMPWKRTLKSTQAGKYDATSYWTYLSDRNADFIHVGPVQRDELIILVRNDSSLRDWTALEDFTGLKIGMVPGYSYTQEFLDLGANGTLTLSEAPSDEVNLRKLLAGRIDAFLIDQTTGWDLISRLFSAEEQAQFRALTKPVAVTEGFLLVPRNIPGSESLAVALQSATDAAQFDLTN